MEASHIEIDWSTTREKLTVLMNMLTCSYCHRRLKEPCNFSMCDHYFCKDCAIILTNQSSECPECRSALWKEHLQLNLKIPDVLAICEKIHSLIAEGQDVFKRTEPSDFKDEISDDYLKKNDLEPKDNQSFKKTTATDSPFKLLSQDGNVKNDKLKVEKEKVSVKKCCDSKKRSGKKKPSFIDNKSSNKTEKNKKLSSEINIPLAFSKNRNEEEDSSDKEDSKKPQVGVFELKSNQIDAPWQVTKRPKLTYSKRVSTSKLKTTKSTVKCSNIHNNEDYSMFDFTDDLHSNSFTHKSNFSDLKEKSKEKVNQVKSLDSSKEKVHEKSKRKPVCLNNKSVNEVDINPPKKSEPQKRKSMDAVNKSLTKRNKKGETSLHAACIKGELQKVRDLLQLGADPNTKDNAGWTPLHEVCNNGAVDIVELLLSHGAILDMVAGDDHDTPLHDAVANNQVDVVKILLERGAPTHKRNRLGQLPVDYASTDEIKTLFKNASLVAVKPYMERDSLRVSVDPLVPKVLVTTNLSKKEKADVIKCCDQLGAKLEKDFSLSVTHVICGVDDSLLSVSRTMKYLLGLLTGKWLLTYQWILDSAAKKQWQIENEYEIKGSPGASDNIPKKSRINRLKLLPGLFEGCSFYFSGIFDEMLPKEKLVELVKCGGGKILLREPKANDLAALAVPNPSIRRRSDVLPKNSSPVMVFHAKENSSQACCTEYIIYDPKMSPRHKKVYSSALCSAPVSWLLDCISCFEILDIRDDEQKENFSTSQN